MEKSNNDNRNQKIKLGILLLLLLLLIGSCGVLSGLFKKDNSMTVTEEQNNLPSSLAYSSVEQSETFIGAENGEGEITYTLIRALDEKGIYVDYFSLLNDKSTQIVIAPNTPAGTYELLIRATASGDGDHKSSSKEFTVKVTVNKAGSVYDVLPTPIEGLVYTGDSMDLINPGQCSTGTIYYKVDDGDWDTSIPQAKEVGTYTVYYKVVGDKNHNDIPEQSFTVTIESAKVGNKPASLTVDYDGQKHTINYTKPAHVIKTGNDSGINAGEYTATYTPEANYVWNDGTNDPVTVTLTIRKAVVNKPTQTSVVKTYNGSLQNNGYSKPDGVVMTGKDSGTEYGEYKATYTPDENHIWNDDTSTSVTVVLSIKRAKLEVPTVAGIDDIKGIDSIEYNGKRHRPVLSEHDKDLISVKGTRARRDAGEYTITLSLKNKNYEWADGSIEDKQLTWSITPKKLAIPSVKTKFVYKENCLHFVTEKDFDDNYDGRLMEIVKNESDKAIDAGEDYHVTLRLRNKRNYCWTLEDGTTSTEDQKINWVIKKARNPLCIDNLQCVKTEYSYNPQTVDFSAPKDDPRVGEVTYEFKSATSLLGPTDNISVDDENKNALNLKEKTSLGIYEVVVNVHATGDKNHDAIDQKVYITLTVECLGYKVVFDSNAVGATGTVPEQTIYGPLPGGLLHRNKYEREEYEFAYWYTSADPNEEGAVFTDGQYVSTDDLYKYANDKGTVTLYAQWKAKEYEIHYDLGDGNFVNEPIYKFTVEDLPLTISTAEEDVSREYYTFVGWLEPGSEEPKKEITITTPGDKYLTAQWKGVDINVYFIDTSNWNDIASAFVDLVIQTLSKPVTLEYGTAYGNNIPKLNKEGYDYGWYTILHENITSSSIVTPTFNSTSSQIAEFIIKIGMQYIDIGIDQEAIDSIVDFIMDFVSSENRVIILSHATPNTNTKYQVNHYLQTLDLQGYELLKEEPEVRFGTTDTKFTDEYIEKGIAKSITGFTYSEFKGDNKINGDGSSAIDIYYTRDVYAINFDSKGGTDVEEQDVPYNGLVKNPGAPSFEEHAFSGWYYQGRPFDFNTRIKGSITLVAMWDITDSVNIIGLPYDPTTGEVTGSGAYKLGDEVELSAIPYEDYRFVRWTDGNTDNPRKFTIAEKDFVIIEDENRNTYFAVFEEVNSRSLVYNGMIEVTAKAGEEVEITGYFRNLLLVDDYSYSGGENNPLSFDIDKSLLGSRAYIKVKEGTTAGTYQTIVTVEPYLIDFTHDKSSVLIIVNVEDNTHKVIFNSNGGTSVAYQTVIDGDYAVEPNSPSRQEYVFDGWYQVIDLIVSKDKFDFENTPIEEDVELIAKWAKFYTVNFDLNGGLIGDADHVDPQTVKEGSKVDNPGTPILDDQHKFGGWYDENDEYFDITNRNIDRNITLKAKWLDPDKYRISVSVAEGCEDMGEVIGGGIFTEGETISIRATANKSFEFDGWLIDNGTELVKTNPLTVNVEENKEFHAVFKSFIDDNNLVNYSEAYFLMDSSLELWINLYPDVIRINDWNGTYKIKNKYPSENNPLYGVSWVLGNVRLGINPAIKPGSYSVDIEVGKRGGKTSIVRVTVEMGYRVIFYEEHISIDALSEKIVRVGEKVDEPNVPDWDGHIFVGWYDNDGNLFDFDTVITKDMILRARWIDARTVTFDPENGSQSFDVNVADGSKVAEPEKPVYGGYSFAGWYQVIGDTVSETEFDFDTPITDNIVLKAKWNKELAVIFDTAGGSSVPAQTINPGEKAIRPADPVKAGWRFIEWYEKDTETGEVSDTPFDFDTVITKDITIVAKWEEKYYEVVYDTNGGRTIDTLYPVKWSQDGLSPDHNPSSYNLLEIFAGWYYVDANGIKISYRNQTYAEVANYNDDDLSVTLYAEWFDRGIVHYTTQITSVKGDGKKYNIKEESPWYVVLGQFEIIDGEDSELFTMAEDYRSISIADKVEPGTYYVRVTSSLSAILEHIGVGQISITDFVNIPENIQSILEEISQTILIEWTVEEPAGTQFGSSNPNLEVQNGESDADDENNDVIPGEGEQPGQVGQDQQANNGPADGNQGTDGQQITVGSQDPVLPAVTDTGTDNSSNDDGDNNDISNNEGDQNGESGNGEEITTGTDEGSA